MMGTLTQQAEKEMREMFSEMMTERKSQAQYSLKENVSENSFLFPKVLQERLLLPGSPFKKVWIFAR